MAKKDDLILIIAKSFARQQLTKSELELCKSMTYTNLIVDHGLNQHQSSEVIKWCKLCCSTAYKSEDLLEEGFFGNIFNKFSNKKRDKTVEKIFKSLISGNYSNIELFQFILDCSALVKAIEREKGISDYRVGEKDHPPEHDWNVQRIQNISRKLFTLQKEFEKIGIKSARKVNESFSNFDRDKLNQKALSIKISYKLNAMSKESYYNKDITTLIRPFMTAVKSKFNLKENQLQELSSRISLFLSNLIDELNESLANYNDAVTHGKLSLSRVYPPPRKASQY